MTIFVLAFINLTSLLRESILFISDLKRPRLLLHGVIQEMNPCVTPRGNLPYLPFIFALFQLTSRAIQFSFLALSDIFQSGFWTSDNIEGHSVHSNQIQGYEKYCCNVQLCSFSSKPFPQRFVFAAYHR